MPIKSTKTSTIELRGVSDDSLSVTFDPDKRGPGDPDVTVTARAQDKRITLEFRPHELDELVRSLVAAGFGREEDPVDRGQDSWVDRDRNPCGCGDSLCSDCRS